jgi:hypothetical protein
LVRFLKERRLKRNVTVGIGGKLGDYVPFYFYSRSVMLYPISEGHCDYSGGQDDIVHLVSSVQIAVALNRPWAFTDLHAELGYATYFDNLSDLTQVDWGVMPLKYWSNSGPDDKTKEKRQAEFLVYQFFPWTGVQQIGVRSSAVATRVCQLLGGPNPPVVIQPDWYY